MEGTVERTDLPYSGEAQLSIYSDQSVASIASGQQVYKGHLMPVPGAKVDVRASFGGGNESRVTARTDSAGHFALDLHGPEKAEWVQLEIAATTAEPGRDQLIGAGYAFVHDRHTVEPSKVEVLVIARTVQSTLTGK
jgi:hypothetical protein